MGQLRDPLVFRQTIRAQLQRELWLRAGGVTLRERLDVLIIVWKNAGDRGDSLRSRLRVSWAFLNFTKFFGRRF